MIYAKLLEFQKLGITLKKDGVNPAFGRGSKYVTLNEVLDKVKKPLNDMGIVLIQEVSPGRAAGSYIGPEHGPCVITRLVDTDYDKEKEHYTLQEVTSYVPLINTPDMQKLGGAITYARRYSLIALLGLEDEDLDGNDAVGGKTSPKGVQDATGDPLKDDFTL